MRGRTFEFEYLCEFKFIIKTNLKSESGNKMGTLDEKKPVAKNHVQVPFILFESFCLWKSVSQIWVIRQAGLGFTEYPSQDKVGTSWIYDQRVSRQAKLE
jgi:hypothetical protein